MTTEKTILYVNNTDPEDGGGGERCLFDQAATLGQLGANPIIVASRTDPDLSSKRTSRGVDIRTVKCIPDAFQRFETLHFYLSRSLFPLISLPVLISIFIQNEVDIVVDCQTPHPSLVSILGPIFSVPVIALVHEYHDWSALEKYPLPIGAIQLTVQNLLRLGLFTAVVVPREHTKQELQKYGVSEPIHVVPNGIDVDTYAKPPSMSVKSYDLLVVSRLEHRKGVDLLLEAMVHVIQDRPSVRLGIAGSGTERETLETMTRQLEIESNVEFLGYVSEERKRALLHESSVFVLPSRQEGFGIAALEAMATGTPIVANTLPVIKSLLPDRPNQLVNANKSDIFASSLLEVLDHAQAADSAGLTNREEARFYDIGAVGEQAASVYEQICSNTTSGV
jgi:glycosyltransferase involved in cell wall biosynthesis